MQQRSDDRLVAYLDGELEIGQRREVEAWLDADPAARQRMAALAESTRLLRHLEFTIEVGDETVVTALLHPWYSCAPRGQPRAAAATRYGPARDGSLSCRPGPAPLPQPPCS